MNDILIKLSFILKKSKNFALAAIYLLRADRHSTKNFAFAAILLFRLAAPQKIDPKKRSIKCFDYIVF
jgi:hypothetical protein